MVTSKAAKPPANRKPNLNLAMHDKIKEFVVIGGGLMGAGIAQVCGFEI